MTETETMVAEARCEAGLQMYLAHADDYSAGFDQGVLTILAMCREQIDMHGVYVLPLYEVHKNPRTSRILRDFQKIQGKKGREDE